MITSTSCNCSLRNFFLKLLYYFFARAVGELVILCLFWLLRDTATLRDSFYSQACCQLWKKRFDICKWMHSFFYSQIVQCPNFFGIGFGHLTSQCMSITFAISEILSNLKWNLVCVSLVCRMMAGSWASKSLIGWRTKTFQPKVCFLRTSPRGFEADATFRCRTSDNLNHHQMLVYTKMYRAGKCTGNSTDYAIKWKPVPVGRTFEWQWCVSFYLA